MESAFIIRSELFARKTAMKMHGTVNGDIERILENENIVIYIKSSRFDRMVRGRVERMDGERRCPNA